MGSIEPSLDEPGVAGVGLGAEEGEVSVGGGHSVDRGHRGEPRCYGG